MAQCPLWFTCTERAILLAAVCAVARASSLETDTTQGLAANGLLIERNLERPQTARSAGKPSRPASRVAPAIVPPYATSPPPPAPPPVANGHGQAAPQSYRVLRPTRGPPAHVQGFHPVLHRAV